MYAKPPTRNVAMIVIGSICLVLGLAAATFFVMNLRSYLNADAFGADDPVLASQAAIGFEH